MVGIFSDPHKVSEDLHNFATLNEGRLYKLMKTCMDPQTDLKGLMKATVCEQYRQDDKQFDFYRLLE
jgi:sister-chromatid-cohesion protein PDS5